jgi:translation initiation factor 5A
MSETKLVGVNEIQKGSFILMNGIACKVVDLETSRPGKHGHSKVRISAVGLVDDKKRIEVMPGHDNVEVPMIEKRNAQVLSVQGNTANVMDSETYETFDIKVPKEFEGQVTDGCSVLYWDIMSEKVIKQVKGAE